MDDSGLLFAYFQGGKQRSDEALIFPPAFWPLVHRGIVVVGYSGRHADGQTGFRKALAMPSGYGLTVVFSGVSLTGHMAYVVFHALLTGASSLYMPSEVSTSL